MFTLSHPRPPARRPSTECGTRSGRSWPRAGSAEQEEIVAKPVNERELLELMRRPAHSDQVNSSLNFSRIWVSKGLLAGSVRRARGQGQTDEVPWTPQKV